MSNKSELIKALVERAGIVKVNNAMNPLLWLSAICLPCCLTAGYSAGLRSAAGIVLLAFPLGVVVSAIVAYFVLMIRDPDRLQSEEFRLRQLEILISSKHGADLVPEEDSLRLYVPADDRETSK